MQQRLSSILLIVALTALPVHAHAASLTAQELQAIVPGLTVAEAAQLAEEGHVTRFFKPKADPRLIPDCSLKWSIQQAFAAVDHTVGVEALFIMSPGKGERADRMLRWYNILRSISTMKGIQYYSVRHKKMRVLFRDSFVVNNLKQQTRLPDPLVSTIPAQSDLTIKQIDSTLGKVLFHLHYQGAKDAISLSMVNLDTLHFWLLPIIGKHQDLLQLVLVPYKNHLIFYGGVEVKTIPLFGLEDASHDSILNRVEALQKWFKNLDSER